MGKSLPKGWMETEFANLTRHVIGGDWGKEATFDNKDYEEVYCIRGSEIKNWNINFGDSAVIRKVKKSSLSTRRLINGDILLEISGGGPDQPVGRVVLITQNTFDRLPGLPIVCTNFLRLVRPIEQINSNYFCSYLEYFYSSGEVVRYQGGSNNLRNLKYKEYETIQIPLPPLAEQERIVAKLDKLFAQHEKIKAALDRIPQLLMAFRQQVLMQAVTGKLTEQWREGKELDEWKTYTVREISDTILGKMLDKAKNSGSEYPYLGNIDVQWNKINTDNLKRIKIDDAEFEKFKLAKGDVLVCEGGEAGRAAIWQEERSNIIFQKALHRVRLYPKFLPKILIYNLELDTKSGRIAELYTGTTIKHLTGQNFAKYALKYCSLLEQQEIVRRVESFFAKFDRIEARYHQLKRKVEALPQAILHKAFNGELVPQLPTDGDAKDLLTEILALNKETKGKRGKV